MESAEDGGGGVLLCHCVVVVCGDVWAFCVSFVIVFFKFAATTGIYSVCDVAIIREV